MKILNFILISLLTPSLFATEAISGPSSYQISDHYDGVKFFNPGLVRSETVWDSLRVASEMMQSSSWKKPEVETLRLSLPDVPKGNTVAVTFVNHASFVIQSSDLTILLDPVWSDRASPLSWIGPKRFVEPGILFDELKRVDVVLLSHNHYDHMDIPSLKKIKDKFDPLFYVALGDRIHLEEAGIFKVQELDWWEEVQFKDAKFTFTPAQHFSARGLFDRNKSLWGGYWISLKGHTIYFAGDTGYSSWFKEIQKRLGSPELALLPIGAYEPYWFMGPIHMNPADAVKAHVDLNPGQSLGMHFGTFKLTTEAVDQPAKDLVTSLNQNGIDLKKFLVPQEGFSILLESR